MGRAGLALLVIASSGFLVTSCGGDDDNGASADKAELVQQANAICKRHSDKIAASASEVLAGGELPSRKQFGKLAQETIVPEYSAQVEELSRLTPPEEMADAYASWLDESEATRAKIEKDPALIQSPDSFASVNSKSDELGLSPDCHAGPGV